MPKPKSDKTPERKQARKPKPKSLLTQADFEAIRRLIREDIDNLCADLRAEFRERTSALAGQVSGLDERVGSLDAEFRERTSALAGQVSGLDDKVGSLDAEFRERTSALAGQVLGLHHEVGSLDAEFRERTSALAGQVLGLLDKVGSLDQRLTELEGRVRLLPTRDEFFSRTGELLTELRTLREEYLLIFEQMI